MTTTTCRSSSSIEVDCRLAEDHTQQQCRFAQTVVNEFVGRGDVFRALMRGGRLVSLLDGERVIAMAHFCLHRTCYSDRIVARVMGCYVLPAWRGEGLRLLREIEEDARREGAEALEFGVNDERFVRLLIHRGYQPTTTICAKAIQ